MSVDTKELLNQLSKTDDIQTFLRQYEKEFFNISPLKYLNDMLSLKNMSVADIARNSGQGEYVYKVFHGERKPSRDVMLAIAVGMKMSVDEAQLLLRIAKLATLDPRDKRDSIIIYSLNEKYDIAKSNDLLYELKQQTL